MSPRSRAGRRREADAAIRRKHPDHALDCAACRAKGAIACVSVGLRPVQDRHRSVELPHDGADDGGRRAFSTRSLGGDWPRPAGARVDRIGASLHGSLAYTGIGHGTDRAVILGLAGETPTTVDPDRADAIVEAITAEQARSHRPAIPTYRFDPADDLVLDRKTPLPGHANGMVLLRL